MTVQALTAKEVTQKIFHKESLFILDVRNENDFSDWKIEGHYFDHLNVPYFDLLDGVEDILEKIPSDKEVLVVCAKEGSSVMVSEMLSEAGHSVSYLKGGMKAWSEHLEPVKVGDLKDGGEMYQFVRIGKGRLSYMVISNGEAAIIDATRMADIFIDFAKEKGAEITHVFDTHLHADHISGGRVIAEKQKQPTGYHRRMQKKRYLIISRWKKATILSLETQRLAFNRFIHRGTRLVPLLSLSMISIFFQVISCLLIQLAGQT